ncbi:MAG: helix-turn-helix transcriptional regulator [Clostridiales bacterium]|nr:helix-turn-helix transcriptional regulator [Candidatus Scatonaster coprocaballi]
MIFVAKKYRKPLKRVDIAGSLVFNSQSHFTKVFYDHTGYTPKQYRMMFFDSNTTRQIET